MIDFSRLSIVSMIKNYVKNIKTMIYYKSSVGDKNGIIKGSR